MAKLRVHMLHVFRSLLVLGDIVGDAAQSHNFAPLILQWALHLPKDLWVRAVLGDFQLLADRFALFQNPVIHCLQSSHRIRRKVLALSQFIEVATKAIQHYSIGVNILALPVLHVYVGWDSIQRLGKPLGLLQRLSQRLLARFAFADVIDEAFVIESFALWSADRAGTERYPDGHPVLALEPALIPMDDPMFFEQLRKMRTLIQVCPRLMSRVGDGGYHLLRRIVA